MIVLKLFKRLRVTVSFTMLAVGSCICCGLFIVVVNATAVPRQTNKNVFKNKLLSLPLWPIGVVVVN